MDAAENKHVVLGLVFLKYISDSFEARRVVLDTDSEARLVVLRFRSHAVCFRRHGFLKGWKRCVALKVALANDGCR